jgi:hypothetical protein
MNDNEKKEIFEEKPISGFSIAFCFLSFAALGYGIICLLHL